VAQQHADQPELFVALTVYCAVTGRAQRCRNVTADVSPSGPTFGQAVRIRTGSRSRTLKRHLCSARLHHQYGLEGRSNCRPRFCHFICNYFVLMRCEECN
jgi:hypothetical protein